MKKSRNWQNKKLPKWDKVTTSVWAAHEIRSKGGQEEADGARSAARGARRAACMDAREVGSLDFRGMSREQLERVARARENIVDIRTARRKAKAASRAQARHHANIHRNRGVELGRRQRRGGAVTCDDPKQSSRTVSSQHARKKFST